MWKPEQFVFRILVGFVFFMPIAIQAQGPGCGTGTSGVPRIQNCSEASFDWLTTYRHKENWIPDSLGTPEKTLHINFNIWQRSDGTGNLIDDAWTRTRLHDMAAIVNAKYQAAPMAAWSIAYPVPHLSYTKLRVVVDSIYFYQDPSSDSSFYYGGNGPVTYGHNIKLDSLLTADYPERCRALNIHLTGSQWGGVGGYSDYGSIESFYRVDMDVSTQHDWSMGEHWAHEIGHSFDLWHTYNQGWSQTCYGGVDFLWDMYDTTTACINFCSACLLPPGPLNNNLMGNGDNFHKSRLQLGIMHRSTVLENFWNINYGVRDHVTGYHTIPWNVTTDETWDFSMKFYQDLVVKSGATLTVQCELQFVPQAGVIIEPGGRLIVDGGRLTGEWYYQDFWRGIEVWGSNAHNQAPSNHPTNQGMLVLKNGATIEHARNITMQQPGTYWTFGGVIQATDANFINCRRSAEFLAYQNTTSGGYPIANRSFFRRCKFSVDENYRGDDDFYAHVSMWGVDGITFSACIFENRQNENAIVVTGSAKLGYGIVSEDASYRVLGVCTTNPPWVGDVCPEYERTVFKGLDHGINARNFGSARNFIVSNCHFEDNVCGVYANHVVGFQVKNSRFLVGGNDVPVMTNPDEEFWEARHRAVFSTESWAFAIDDNELVQSGTYAQTEGIVVGYSRDHNDVVFRNHATGLESAYIGEGISADLTSGYTATRGLWFLCNENLGNTRNFWARKVTNDPGDQNDHTIRLNQGLPSRPADNTFDQLPGVDGQADFKLTTTHSPVAYWHRNTGNYVPEHFTQSTTGLFPAPATGIPLNNCAQKVLLIVTKDPSYPSGMAPGPVVQYLLETKLAFGNTRYLYEQLIDDGNTDEVVLQIQESWPQDAWDLRSYLLSKSPYLSATSLKEVVLKNIMPTAMVTEILVANPAATRSDGFLPWLQEKSGYPLPEYLLGMVVASWDVRGYRDALEAEMTLHHGEMTQAANLLIHHYHTLPMTEDDSTSVPMDSVLWVWQQVRTPAARYAEALTWMQLGNYAQAADVIASLPTEHKLRSPDELERQRMLDLIGFIANVRGSGRSEMQLDSSEVAYLKVLMGEAYDRPAALIGNLLCFGYGHCRAPLTGGDIDGDPKSLPYTPLTATGTGTQAELRIHPNPASTWVAIDYDLLVEPTDAAIIIRDMTGREVERIVLRDRLQQVVWDSREVAPGTYTVVLQNKKHQLRTEKLIIRQ
jgi:hypothetical protein